MRILVTGHSVNHSRQKRMWEWIGTQGHEVLLCGPDRWSDEEYQKERKEGFIGLPLRVADLLNIYHYTMPDLLSVMERAKPDVLMCYEEPPSLFAYQCKTLAELFRIPFVVFTWENLTKIFSDFHRNIEKNVLQTADLIIAGNRDAARILSIKDCSNICILPQTGLDSELFRPLPEIQINKTKKRVLYVGRMVEEKDIEGILVAWEHVIKQEVGDAELLFVGGRGTETAKVLNHYDYGKRVFWQGWTQYEQLPEIYSSADVFVYPSIDTSSWSEQWGAATLEALLCEVPLVTNISGAIPEYAKCPDTTFISQGDRDALGWSIEKVLRNPFRAKKGREHVIKTCSIPVIGEKYIQALESIV